MEQLKVVGSNQAFLNLFSDIFEELTPEERIAVVFVLKEATVEEAESAINLDVRLFEATGGPAQGYTFLCPCQLS